MSKWTRPRIIEAARDWQYNRGLLDTDGKPYVEPIDVERAILEFGIRRIVLPDRKISEGRKSRILMAVVPEDRLLFVNEEWYMEEALEDEYRFALGHELGHLVLHKHRNKQFTLFESNELRLVAYSPENRSSEEREADAFSAVFMCPYNMIRHTLTPISEVYRRRMRVATVRISPADAREAQKMYQESAIALLSERAGVPSFAAKLAMQVFDVYEQPPLDWQLHHVGSRSNHD